MRPARAHVIVATLCLMFAARGSAHVGRWQAPAQPAGLVTADPRLEEVRRDISNGTFVPRTAPLTPCFASDVIAFTEEWKSRGATWAG